MATMTKTRSKTVSSTKLAVSVGILTIAGAAAFGALGGPATRGYQNFYTQCHDGSTLQDDGTVSLINGGESHGPTLGCRLPAQWKETARTYCRGATNTTTGKVGVNTYKITNKCTIRSTTYGYGYGDTTTSTIGYGYGSEKVAPKKTSKIRSFFQKRTRKYKNAKK